MEFEQAALIWAQRRWPDVAGEVEFDVVAKMYAGCCGDGGYAEAVISFDYKAINGSHRSMEVHDAIDDIMREIVAISHEEQ